MFEYPLIPLVAGNPCGQRSRHPPSRSPFESDSCPVEHDYKGDDDYDDDGDYQYIFFNLTSRDMIIMTFMTLAIMNIIMGMTIMTIVIVKEID